MRDERRQSGHQSHPGRRAYARCISHPQDELRIFRTPLRYLFLDQSNAFTATLSWLFFFVFVILIPCLAHFALTCDACEKPHTRPYDVVAQLSLSSVAALSFISLSSSLRKYGLRRFLFFDKLREDSETVRNGYTQQVNRSLKILFIFVLPSMAAEIAYKTWWYISSGNSLPFLGNKMLSNTVACVLELISWFYRSMVFFLVCVIFRLVCYLQILRMQGFAMVFQVNTDVLPLLKEHLKIRRQLRIISRRYRYFILLGLLFITASQFTALLIALRPATKIDIFHCGELAVSSLSLLAGLMIILRSAARITHKAQAVTSFAAKWHVCATIDSFDMPTASRTSAHSDTASDFEETDIDEDYDELENTNFVPSYTHGTITFQKRQALVAYLENNKAGITALGFMLDRGNLYTIFGIELSLVMWLLGKTIGI